MSYTTGSIITKGDYNVLVTGSEDGTYNTEVPNLGIVWGVGYGRYGYGQDLEFIAPVQVGDPIRSQEWDNMDAVLSNVLDHQFGNGTYEGLPGGQIAAGQLISPITTFAPHIFTAHANVGQSYSNVDDPVRTLNYSGYWGNTGSTTLRFVQNIDFPSSDAARYFFNAGGKLKLTFSNHPAVTTSRNTMWSRICASAGTITIGYRNTTKTDGSGAANRYQILNQNNGGFWAHAPGSPSVTHFKQFDPLSTPYGYGYGYGYGYYNYGGYGGYGYGQNNLDYLKVDMVVSNSDGQNGNPGSRITVITSMINGSVMTPSSLDEISGTVNVNLTVSRPSNVYLPVASWGPYSYNNATVSAV